MSNKNQWWHRNLRSFKAKSSQCLVSPDNNLGTLCNVQRQKQTDRRTPNRIWWNQVPIRRAIYRRFAPRVVCRLSPPAPAARRLPPLYAALWGSCGDDADYFCRHLRCHRLYLYNPNLDPDGPVSNLYYVISK